MKAQHLSVCTERQKHLGKSKVGTRMLGNAVHSAVKLLSASEVHGLKIWLIEIQKQRKPAWGFSPFQPLSGVFHGSEALRKSYLREKFMLKCKFTEWEACGGLWGLDLVAFSPCYTKTWGWSNGQSIHAGCGLHSWLLVLTSVGCLASGPHEGLGLTTLRYNVRC